MRNFLGPSYSACAEFVITRSTRGREDWGQIFRVCGVFGGPSFPSVRNSSGPAFPLVRNFFGPSFSACAEFFEAEFSVCAEFFGGQVFPLVRNFWSPAFPLVRNFWSAGFSACAELRPYVEPPHGYMVIMLTSGRSCLLYTSDAADE